MLQRLIILIRLVLIHFKSIESIEFGLCDINGLGLWPSIDSIVAELLLVEGPLSNL